MFPDVFRLAADKDGTVQAHSAVDGNSRRWGWGWLREPSSGSEWGQIGLLMGLLNNVSLINKKDSWVWDTSSGEAFSIKCIRQEIDSWGSDQAIEACFKWNSWATPKSNYLLWRAISGKVASKYALNQRGIPLQSIMSDRCGLKVETSDHVFVESLFAQSIWWNVFVWSKVPFPRNVATLRDLLKDILESPGNKTWMKLIYMVAAATVWRMWQARNNKTFEWVFVPVLRTVEFIKEDAFVWLKNRTKLPPLAWEKWIYFDVLDLL
ncbi:uncharacterized protein LOC110889070 [Helianthus annuus]|uniref:uncharacterized protein LOC110889070 n=1 Tax=Helianthus annuus TaxID=4232 RepID=UPI000B90264A|nr:uncharacterized protein LOC110889070 [Helianthus annuus]